ncbi:MAG: MFS transporter [Roseiflexaceae bacterium]|nr:MFS transporter [Roseiflexaceae bacterium]
MRGARVGLWRSPDFLKLWAGQTVSLFGSHIGGGAVRYTALLILLATPAQLGLLTAASLLPGLLLSLPVGAWIDRVRRRPLLIAADLGRALLLLSIPIAFVLGQLRIELLYLVAALATALTVVFETAYHAYLPSVVQREQLTDGNSKLSASESLAEVAGPPLGGVLVQVINAPLAVLADSCSFLVSAWALWQVRTPEPHPEPENAPDLWLEVVEGLRATFGDRRLVALLGQKVTGGLVGGVIGSLYDLYLIRELGFSPALVGLTIGVGGAAALIGALLAERVARNIGLGWTLAGAILLSSITTGLIPLAAGSAALALLLVSQLSDVAHAIYGINEISLRQAIVPPRLLGRVGATFNLLPTAAALLGAFATGPLVAALGVRGALVCAAIVAGGSVLWIVCSPLLQMREVPEQ